MEYSLYDSINYHLQKEKGKILDTIFEEDVKIYFLSRTLDKDMLNEISNGKIKVSEIETQEVYIKD